MKKFLLLLILVSGTFAKAQVDSTIYGLARMNPPSKIYFAKIDPLTGVVTNISTSSFSASLAGIATIDPFKNIYYFINYDSGTFTGIDMITGDIVSNPIITNSNGDYFDGFLFNCSDSTIYGLARKNPPSEIHFAKIDPSTGVVTNISTSSFSASLTSIATINSFNNIYYFINYDSGTFTGIDMTNGNIVSNPIITNSNGTYFDKFFFNCSDSIIYGLARKSSPTEIYFAKIDPSTGVVTNISASSVATNILMGGTTIDPFNKIYYFITDGTTFVGIDITTGNMISNPTITNANGTYFDGFVCENNCCTKEITLSDNTIIEMPNVFTPNNDGNNDTFHPSQIKGISDTRLLIYNRWGGLLFETNDLLEGWNGKIKNKEAANGTYFWLLEYVNVKNEPSHKTGFLTLMK